jgi:hypothetical protein
MRATFCNPFFVPIVVSIVVLIFVTTKIETTIATMVGRICARVLPYPTLAAAHNLVVAGHGSSGVSFVFQR